MASMIDGNVIYDPFAGFGGRMLGTLSLGKKYIGCDINPLTVNGNLALMNELNLNANATVVLGDSSKTKCLSCDGIITSPPYMNLDSYETNTFKDTTDFQNFIHNVFSGIRIKDKAIIDFKRVKGCTLDQFQAALPFSKIERMNYSFGGMARSGKQNQSVHTWFICKQ
jgi:tRNA G10  N-methylase Trm11